MQNKFSKVQMLICIVLTLFATVKRTFVLIFAYRSMHHKKIENLNDILCFIMYHQVSNDHALGRNYSKKNILKMNMILNTLFHHLQQFLCKCEIYSALKICWQMAIPENRPILHCVLSKSIQNCKNKCAFFPAEFCTLFIS